MKIFKYISLTSLTMIIFKVFGAMSAQANGTYNAESIRSLVGIIFIFVVSTVLWGVFYIFKKK